MVTQAKRSLVHYRRREETYATITDPEAFYRRAVKLYHEWKASQPGGETETEEELVDGNGAKAASITFEQAEEQAWQEIQQYLREMKPYDFQDLVAALLRAMGYHVSWISPPGKDGASTFWPGVIHSAPVRPESRSRSGGSGKT